MIIKDNKVVKRVFKGTTEIKQIRYEDLIVYEYIPDRYKLCEYINTTTVDERPYIQFELPSIMEIGNYSKHNNTFKIYGGKIDLDLHNHPLGHHSAIYFQFVKIGGNVPTIASSYMLNSNHYSDDACWVAWGSYVTRDSTATIVLEDALLSNYFCAAGLNSNQIPNSWGYITFKRFRIGGNLPAKYHSFSVSYNGDMSIIDMHLVPVYDTVDNLYGMYDTINDVFYSSVTEFQFSGKIIQ